MNVKHGAVLIGEIILDPPEVPFEYSPWLTANLTLDRLPRESGTELAWDNVIYGSDYPHTIGDMPGCLRRVNGLAGAARDKVRGQNAQRVFGL